MESKFNFISVVVAVCVTIFSIFYAWITHRNSENRSIAKMRSDLENEIRTREQEFSKLRNEFEAEKADNKHTKKDYEKLQKYLDEFNLFHRDLLERLFRLLDIKK